MARFTPANTMFGTVGPGCPSFAMIGVRPQGAGSEEADVSNLLLLLRLGRVLQQFLRATLSCSARPTACGLRVQTDALLHQTFGLLLGDLASAGGDVPRRPRADLQVGLPTERLHVDLTELRIQMPVLFTTVNSSVGVGDSGTVFSD